MTEVPEDQARDLDRGAKEMEQELERLEGDIETAQDKAAEQRERANPKAVAGDFEDASAGAHEGEDPQGAAEAEGPGQPTGEGGAAADAPVHEAEQVDPGGGED